MTKRHIKKIVNTIIVSLGGGIAGMIGVGTVWIATAGLPSQVRFILEFLVAVMIGWWVGGVGLQLFPHLAPVNLGNDDGREYSRGRRVR